MNKRYRYPSYCYRKTIILHSEWRV